MMGLVEKALLRQIQARVKQALPACYSEILLKEYSASGHMMRAHLAPELALDLVELEGHWYTVSVEFEGRTWQAVAGRRPISLGLPDSALVPGVAASFATRVVATL